MWSLVLFLLFALPRNGLGEYDNEYHALRTVFTSLKLQSHDLTLSRFQSIINHHQLAKSSSSNSLRSSHANLPNSLPVGAASEDHYLLCASSQQSLEIKSKIISLTDINKIHTVYTSKSENLICFISLLDHAMASTVAQYDGIKSLTIVPEELKIHESLIYFFDLIENDHLAYNELSRRYSRSKGFDLSTVKLVASGSLGVPHKDLQSASNLKLDNLKHKLSQSDADSAVLSSLKEMALLRSGDDSPNFWSKHVSSLELALEHERLSFNDICSFKSLSIQHTGHSLVIGGLHHLQQSPHSKSCIASLLSYLLTSKLVSDIRLRFPKRAFNNYIKGIVQQNSRSEDYPYTAVGLDGTGQVIGIGDTGVDEYSCFFRNPDGSKVARSSPDYPTYNMSKRKVIQYINYADGTDTEGGHGTHVSGTVAGSLYGSDTTYQNYNGHASGAKIAFFDMEDSNHPEYGLSYPSITKFFNCAYQAGARIHSNSWGGSLNAYDEDTLSMDQYLVTNQDFLAIFAAGNDGSQGYYSIGDPAVSKNCLSVGASNSTSIANIAFFSSLGPTFDSRIKPEVVAPGFYTYSAKASGSSEQTCEILDMAGTSMATPCVSGNAGIIRQYFVNYNSSANNGCTYTHGTSNLQLTSGFCDANTNPRGATVKAMLIHSGQPMFAYETSNYKTEEPRAVLSSPPDMYQGFGRVSLQNILPYPGIEDILKIHVTETSINSLQQYVTKVQVADASRPFKATLVYMDPANTMMSTKMLINNLDLIVEDPDGNIYYGNGIAGDDINNVEQVHLANPTAGTGVWSVRVESDILPESGDPALPSSSTQLFTLIISAGDLSVIESNYLNMTSYNPHSCTDTQQLVSMTLFDNGGDGWGTGNSYQIIDTSDGSIIQSGTMSPSIPTDLMSRSSFCLDFGVYNVSLIQSGPKSNEMSLEINQCHLYLSEYQPSGSISISSKTDCNPCMNYLLTMTLRGSLYGIPYGWKNSSHYTLTQTAGPDPSKYLNLEGTLIASPFLDHSICLSNGTYVVKMRDIPKNDDFLADDDYYSYLQPQVGVEEYRIYFNSNKKYKMQSNQKAIITVTGKTATIKIKKPSNSEMYRLSTGGIIGLILTAILLTAALFIVFFDTTTSIQRIKRFLGLQGGDNIDEIPMVNSEQQEE